MLPSDVTKAEIEDAVSEMLTDLCLEKVAAQTALTLNSSEMRRVSLGIGFVMRPQIILANELTSSLYSQNVEVVMELCLRIAKVRNIFILVTIHQSNNIIISMLENTIVMNPTEGHLQLRTRC